MLNILNDDWSLIDIENSSLCDAAITSGLDNVLNRDLGDMTEEDLAEALAANVDSDLSQFLGRDRRGQLDIQGQPPPTIEPFKTIYETINDFDENVGEVLDKMKKYLSNIKSFSGLLSSNEFCCIIYTIVFISVIIEHHKACPEEPIENMWAFWAGNYKLEPKYFRDLLDTIDMLREIIRALNTELVIDISIIGVGLPLGTLMEVLKHTIGNILSLLFAIFIAPIEKVLNDLANAPGLQQMLNQNCFNIAALLDFLRCAIQWLLDLIKELAKGLFDFSAKNIELLQDVRIGNMRFAFLKNLLKLLDLLRDLLISVGDCFTPEDVARRVVLAVGEQPEQELTFITNALEETGHTTEEFDAIGADDAGDLFEETTWEDAVDEVQNIADGTLGSTMPLLLDDTGTFEEAVRAANSRPLRDRLNEARAIAAFERDLPREQREAIEVVEGVELERRLARIELDTGESAIEFIEAIAQHQISRKLVYKKLLNLAEAFASLKR